MNTALDRRRRRQNAVLLCGEILAAVERILVAARQLHAEEGNFDQVILRLLRATGGAPPDA